MIVQRKSALHMRDREIAAMPLSQDSHDGEHWIISLALWLAMVIPEMRTSPSTVPRSGRLA